jgi:hypothetical protein
VKRFSRSWTVSLKHPFTTELFSILSILLWMSGSMTRPWAVSLPLLTGHRTP